MYSNFEALFKVVGYWYRLAVISVFVQFELARGFRLESFGTEGANWWLPVEVIEPNWLVYSVGVGEDISFDTELVSRYDCRIFAFDPTPRSIKFMKNHHSKQIRFIPLGIWRENALLKFYEPANQLHVSHSIVNLQDTDKYFQAACVTIKTLMSKLGHTKIDCLKLDIEGAEFAVLTQMIESGIFPKVIAVEFDQPCQISQMINCIKNLSRHSYVLIKQDFFNFVFLRND